MSVDDLDAKAKAFIEAAIAAQSKPPRTPCSGCDACVAYRTQIQAHVDAGDWVEASKQLASPNLANCRDHRPHHIFDYMADLGAIVQREIYLAIDKNRNPDRDDLFDEEAYYAQDIVENGIVAHHVTGDLAAYRKFGAAWWSIDEKIAGKYASGIARNGSFTAHRPMADRDPTCVTATLRPRKIATTADLLAIYFAQGAPSRYQYGAGGTVTPDSLLSNPDTWSPVDKFGGTYVLATEVKDALIAQGYDAVLCRDGMTWFDLPHYTIYWIGEPIVDEISVHVDGSWRDA